MEVCTVFPCQFTVRGSPTLTEISFMMIVSFHWCMFRSYHQRGTGLKKSRPGGGTLLLRVRPPPHWRQIPLTGYVSTAFLTRLNEPLILIESPRCYGVQ